MFFRMLFSDVMSKLSSNFSIAYLGIFLPICLFIYQITPQKLRKYYLLLVSFGYYFILDKYLIAYLLFTIISVYLFGLILNKINRNRDVKLSSVEKEEKKIVKKKYKKVSIFVLIFSIVIHIGIIFTVKYLDFFLDNIRTVFGLINIKISLSAPNLLAPIGISFFTLTSLSYLIDVYRETIKADKNIFRLALFISFFPQIVEGPITRYDRTADQLWNVQKIKYDNFVLGLERILYGMLKKVVIADRLNPLTTEGFTQYLKYDGIVVLIAGVAYTIQLYMDFSGSMDAVIGVSQIFGIEMPVNFACPFFSKTISEFWQRWHITLGSWFSDYIFYPITMSKSMKHLTVKGRKKLGNHFGPLLSSSIALFCVWLCDGLWHGAGWNYIFYGMYHLFFIVLENIFTPFIKSLNCKMRIDMNSLFYRVYQSVRTTAVVIIGEIIFEASSLSTGIKMIIRMFTNSSFSSITNELIENLGVDYLDIAVVFITLLLVFVVSVMNERGIKIRDIINKQNTVVKWSVIYLIIIYIVIFGAYGMGYIPVDPMYANF